MYFFKVASNTTRDWSNKGQYLSKRKYLNAK